AGGVAAGGLATGGGSAGGAAGCATVKFRFFSGSASFTGRGFSSGVGGGGPFSATAEGTSGNLGPTIGSVAVARLITDFSTASVWASATLASGAAAGSVRASFSVPTVTRIRRTSRY